MMILKFTTPTLRKRKRKRKRMKKKKKKRIWLLIILSIRKVSVFVCILTFDWKFLTSIIVFNTNFFPVLRHLTFTFSWKVMVVDKDMETDTILAPAHHEMENTDKELLDALIRVGIKRPKEVMDLLNRNEIEFDQLLDGKFSLQELQQVGFSIGVSRRLLDLKGFGFGLN
jgi:hypothetical protein